MKTVRFLVSRTVQREDGPTYEVGSVHSLRDDQAKHWISRGVAELVFDAAPSKVEAVVEVAKVEDVTSEVTKVDEAAVTTSAPKPWEVPNGNAVESTKIVDTPNDSGDGERPKPVPRRRTARPRT